MKAANSYASPWEVASNPTGTLNYDDTQTALLAATPGTGYTTGTGLTIGSCSVAGSGMVVNMQANSGGVGTFQAVTSVGTGYTIGETCTVTQGGNSTGTATIWGYPIESSTPRRSSSLLRPTPIASPPATRWCSWMASSPSMETDRTTIHRSTFPHPVRQAPRLPIWRGRARRQLSRSTGTINYGIRNGTTSAYFNIFGLSAAGIARPRERHSTSTDPAQMTSCARSQQQGHMLGLLLKRSRVLCGSECGRRGNNQRLRERVGELRY